MASKKERGEQMRERGAGDPSPKAPTRGDPPTKAPPKGDPPTKAPPKEDPPTKEPPREDPPKEDPPREDPPKEEDWDLEELPPIEVYPNEVKEPRVRERYTPFLVLRYAAGDGGARPIPSGTVHWHSPDVWVESSLGHNQPVAGEENAIFARVNNLGAASAGWVRVRYWWANPSLAINETEAHLIGTADAYVPAHYSVVVKCPTAWVPIMENGGHECVFAEAFVPSLDPLTAPLEPVSDRHVCQKNLTVQEIAPKAQIALNVWAANLGPAETRVEILAFQLPFEVVAQNLKGPAVGWRGEVKMTEGPLTMRLKAGEAGAPVKRYATWARRLLAEEAAAGAKLRAQRATQQRASAGKEGATGGETLEQTPVATLTLTMGAGERRPVTILAKPPEGAQPGQAFGVHVVERIGERVMGGYTVYIVIAKAD